MIVSVTSPQDAMDDMQLRAFCEFELRNRILSVAGVAQVVAIGGDLPEYQILIDQNRLLQYDLSTQDLIEAAERAHRPVGAGYLPDHEGRELPIRQTGAVRSVRDIQETVIGVADNGAPITIGQVAEVRRGAALKRGTGAEDGASAVVLSIKKSPGTNTLALSEQIDRVLAEAETAAGGKLTINRHVMRQADFIRLSVANVLSVARDAAIIVAVILVLFLMNVRTTLITLTAIPMSIALALLVLSGFGQTINVMTLGGLAVAIGVVVDDAIIFVENAHRRLGQSGAASAEQRVEVVHRSFLEILGSVLFATIIIVMVFVPLLFLQGLEGRFFMPLGLMYIASIGASLGVALTLTPALCVLLLRGRGSDGDESDSRFVRWIKALYRPALMVSIRFKRTVLVGAVAATVASVGWASTFGTSFLPSFNEGTFTVFLMAPPGTSLVESDRLARGVERRLTEIEGIRSVVRRTGRAERDEHAEPVSSSEIEVALLPGYGKNEIRRKIDRVISQIPGITTMIGQPIEHRLSHVLSGTPAAVSIDVFGEDLDKLRTIAKEIEAAVKKIPGARDVNANREVMITTLPVRYRRQDLRRWGLPRASAADQVRDAFFGQKVASINEGVRVYDLVVRLQPDQRQSIEDLERLILRGRGGALVRLKEVADIGPEQASNLITRQNARRKAVVSCNVAEGFNLGDLVADVRRVVDPIVIRKHGYSVRYGGQFEAQQSASKTLYAMGGAVVGVMGLLLAMALGSTRAALLVLVNLPLALMGGIVAIYLTESGLLSGALQTPVISIASMVGFITLFGIAVRNGILLVNHYQWLMDQEGLGLAEAIERGSMERLVPILMTALTAVLGLMPLALAKGQPGSELLAPLAIVVLGGLVSSTFLNLVVVPAGYAWLFSKQDGHASAADDKEISV